MESGADNSQMQHIISTMVLDTILLTTSWNSSV
jgi:hypothetical protein